MATSGMDPALLQVEALLVEKNRSEKDKNNANFLSEPLNKITVQEIENSVLQSKLEQIKLKTPVIDILEWKPESTQVNNVNLEKIQKKAQNYGINPNLIQPNATDEISYMHKLSVEDDLQQQYRLPRQFLQLSEKSNNFCTPTRGQVQPVVNLQTLQSMQQMQNTDNIMPQKTTFSNAPEYTPLKYTQALPLNEAIQALNSVNLPGKIDKSAKYLLKVSR